MFDAKGYEQYEDMIDESDIDAVTVATPDFLHKAPVIYAAKRAGYPGRKALCNKC